MRILIDTNILIQLEDNQVIKKEFSSFYSISISNNCKIFYHPAVIEDIKNDKDVNRQEILLSKLSKYQPLPKPAVPSAEFLSLVGEKKSNDAIDNKQLYQVHMGYVELFITEDKEILRKAAKLGLADKILSIESGLTLINKTYHVSVPTHPLLKEGSVREIIHLKDTSFFDSLREDYGLEFNEWLIKCAQQDRKAYYLMDKDILLALLIYKNEPPVEHTLQGIFENAFKICTLKVAEDAFGYKMGELFLSKMFALCIESTIRYLYISLFPKHTKLLELLRNFGFSEHYRINNEIFMLKSMNKEKAKGSNTTEEHPFYCDQSNFQKFIISIQENYATTLFKDSEYRYPELFDTDFTKSKSEIEGVHMQFTNQSCCWRPSLLLCIKDENGNSSHWRRRLICNFIRSR